MQTKLYDIKEWCQHGYELENYPYIGTIDGKTDIHEALKIGSKYYIPSIVNFNNNTAGVRLSTISTKPENKEYEDNIVCPYCGHEDRDSYELSDDNDTIECGRCGATIEYTREVIASYSIKGIKPPKIVTRKFVADESV